MTDTVEGGCFCGAIIIDITLGSLDTPENYTPTFDVFEDTRLPFLAE